MKNLFEQIKITKINEKDIMHGDWLVVKRQIQNNITNQ